MYSAHVVADSIAPSGCRLTTILVEMPRPYLAELNTHRVLTRNSASSRAIPFDRQINRMLDAPYVPVFLRNRPGMQGGDPLGPEEQQACEQDWMMAMSASIDFATKIANRNVHKQHVSRLLEPFMRHVVLLSATTWENFLLQRDHSDAQPEMQQLAAQVRAALDGSEPRELMEGDWHLPFHDAERDRDIEPEDLPKVCAARCARMSYLTHDGQRDPEADLNLYQRLCGAQPMHLSPLEHPARALRHPIRCGNFTGWRQLRKMLPGESGETVRWRDELLRDRELDVEVSVFHRHRQGQTPLDALHLRVSHEEMIIAPEEAELLVCGIQQWLDQLQADGRWPRST